MIVPVMVNLKENIKESRQLPDVSMGASRFSDVYQRIDMEQSMASSVFIRDPKNRYY